MEQINEGMMFLTALANRGDNFDDLLPKALAHYLFREIIEDVHTKYGISQEEMKQMNKKAANRAKLFVERVSGNELLEVAFSCMAVYCDGWDAPEITEEEESTLAFFKKTEKQIREMKANIMGKL